jgi:UTP--glucose-1-phosphate uridylyltransferase
METEIKKVILPIAGLGTRFLPLSKIMPKEIWPLVDKPIIQALIEEARASGIKQAIFVTNDRKNLILDYLKSSPSLKRILQTRKKDQILEELESIEKINKDMNFSSVTQDKPLGDGHAILQAVSKVKKEAVGVMFGDDIVDSEIPCLQQLINIFKTCQRPVVALHRLPKEKLSAYGVPKLEKIANRVFKIKKITEKPAIGEEPSDLAIVGKYILTPDVFDYLKTAKPNKNGEIVLADTFDRMLREGKTIYGYEFEGKWLECGSKVNWLKSNIYFSLKDPRFKEELKNFIKENNLF